MYRQYEDPYALEERFALVKQEYEMATDEQELIYLAEEMHELKDRINFAWQDYEY